MTNWGIIGPGKIAHAFAKGLSVIENAQLKAVASTNLERAQSIAKEFDISQAYGNYDEMLSCEDNDVVYISTINTLHEDCIMKAFSYGKPVLCEKPLGTDPGMDEFLFAEAKKANLFLMEAYWTTFLPSYCKAKNWLEAGYIGTLRQIDTSFNYMADPANERLFKKELGGGCYYDVGIYTIGLVCDFFGMEPRKMVTNTYFSPDGIDVSSSAILDFGFAQSALMRIGFYCEHDSDAVLWGTEGHIILPSFWNGTEARLYRGNRLVETFTCPHKGSGYEYEALEVMHCLDTGDKTSSIMPPERTLRIARLVEQGRTQC